MSKELFDEVVGTPPPSTVDIQAIVRRRRRAIAARRLGVGIMSVVAVAAVGTTALAIAGGPGTREEVVPFATATATATATAGASVDLNAEHLRESLALAVAARVPDARWLPDGQPPVIGRPPPPTVSCANVHGCDPGEPVVTPAETELLLGIGDLERPGITGMVYLAIKADESSLVCTESTTDICVAGVSPTGVRMAIRSSLQTAGGPVTTRRVTLELPGARTLDLAAYAPTTGTVGVDPAVGTVLTEAELVDIATNIAGRIVG